MTAIRIALISLILCCYAVFTASAASNPTGRYYDTRAELERLFEDKNPTARYRDAWINIANQFAELYKKNPSWNLRPAALYREARAYEGLAQHSFRRTDATKAIKTYLSVAEQYPDHTLADDALICAARIYQDQLKDTDKAIRVLRSLLERYPNGDMSERAKQTLSQIETKLPSAPKTSLKTKRPPSHNRTPQPPQPSIPHSTLTYFGCTSHTRDLTVSLTLSAPVQWRVYSTRANSKPGQQPRLVIELPNTRIGNGILRNKKFQGILNKASLSRTSSGTICITLALKSLYRYQVTTSKSQKTITILASSRTNALPKGKQAGEDTSAPRPFEHKNQTYPNPDNIPANIATHLGLGVRTIVIDPGHGGSDPGALGNKLIEKHVNLDMSKRVSKRLKQLGFSVRTTRDRDVRVPLDARTRFANTVNGDLFVSIHVNANENKTVYGIETYYLDFARSDAAARVAAVENAVSTRNLGDMESMIADIMLNARTSESQHLADCIQKSVIRAVRQAKFKTRDNGVRSAPLHVLIGSGMPGILIEIGYCSNSSEARRLARDDYRNALAEGIAKGIEQYTRKLAKF